MADKHSPQEEGSKRSSESQYACFYNDPLWPVIEKAIGDLAGNNDIKEMTSREYIVGYLMKEIRKK